uniref:Galectin n=1 Tax=Tetraodon nigroviridis TaxID=99883 RepID=H3CA75_TETNG
LLQLKDALDGWSSSTNAPRGGPSGPGQPNPLLWPGHPPPDPLWSGASSGGGALWPGSGGPAFPGPAAGPGPAPGRLTVPHEEELPAGVFANLLITINGSVHQHANKITVDLTTERADLAFHFNPRFNENGQQVIVRNSCVGNQWGPEERDLLGGFPFVKDKPFEMKILCTDHEFRVAVDERHLLAFQHRVRDLRSIRKLSIYNDLSLSAVRLETLR